MSTKVAISESFGKPRWHDFLGFPTGTDARGDRLGEVRAIAFLS